MFYEGVSWSRAWDETAITVSGYAVMFAALALLRHWGRETAYTAVVTIAMYLSLVGSAKVLPFMGIMPTASGSLYFPFVLMAIAFAHRQFGNVTTLNIIYGSIIGLLFASVGYLRWYLFGVLADDPDVAVAYEQIVASYEAGRNTRDAMLAMVAVFLGGTAIIILKQWLARVLDHPYRFFIAVGFVILFTTPIFVGITVSKNPVWESDYWHLLFNTYVVRYSVIWPVFMYLWACKVDMIPASCVPFKRHVPHPDDADFSQTSYQAP